MTLDPAKAESAPEMADDEPFDRPITVTCPDYGGALRRSAAGTLVKYACHISHLYTAEAMAAAQCDQMERIMRAAERILNERAEFCRQMAERGGGADESGRELWLSASQEAAARVYTVRDFIEQDWITPTSVGDKIAA